VLHLRGVRANHSRSAAPLLRRARWHDLCCQMDALYNKKTRIVIDGYALHAWRSMYSGV